MGNEVYNALRQRFLINGVNIGDFHIRLIGNGDGKYAFVFTSGTAVNDARQVTDFFNKLLVNEVEQPEVGQQKQPTVQPKTSCSFSYEEFYKLCTKGLGISESDMDYITESVFRAQPADGCSVASQPAPSADTPQVLSLASTLTLFGTPSMPRPTSPAEEPTGGEKPHNLAR